MRLVLIRHGKTVWNAQRRIQGRLDSPLTIDAIKQLENIELPALAHPILFSSDLGRAQHSADIIAEKLMAEKIGGERIVDQRLRERQFGVLEGQVIDAGSHLAAEWASYHHRYQQKIQNIWGVESEEAFEQRIRSFLADLSAYHAQAGMVDIVIVGHGEWLRACINLLMGQPSWHGGRGIEDNGKPVVLSGPSSVYPATVSRK